MSSSSYASITALTVLENPRSTTTKGLVFDGHFYLGSSSRQEMLGSLRYFNKNDTQFAPVGLYFAYITVAQVDPTSAVELFIDPASETKREDFAFVGDIQFLFYLGDPDKSDIDFIQRPYVHICGVALNTNKDAATFNVDADQYTSAMRDLQKDAKNKKLPAPRSYFPTFCTIQNSPRYEHVQKPVPFNKRYVMLAGYITDITSALDGNTVKDTFCIDVENIAFLGSQVASATGGTVSTPASTSSSGSAAPGKRWSYNTPRNNNSGANKRPRTDDAASSSPAAGRSSPSPLT